jgi:hypothetical protein
MALEYHTGFDMIAAGTPYTQLKQMGWTHSSADTGTVSTTLARNGTRSLQLSVAAGFLCMANLSPAVTRIVGFGCQVQTLAGTQRPIVAVGDGGALDVAANVHVAVSMDPTGHLELRRGANLGAAAAGTLLATSTNALTAATWHFIELVATIDNTVGTAEVYVNGSKTGWIDFTGDTQNSAAAFSTVIGFGCGNIQVNVDDVYTLTTTGAVPTTRLGDCKSVVKFPGTDAALGAGVYGDSTPLTASDRGAMVDDNPVPDDDTTYTALTAPLQKDAYKTAALGLTGTILGVTVRARLRKTDAGDGSAQIGLRSGTTDDVSPDVLPTTAYQWFSRSYVANPATSTLWTMPALDAAQILVKRTT